MLHPQLPRGFYDLRDANSRTCGSPSSRLSTLPLPKGDIEVLVPGRRVIKHKISETECLRNYKIVYTEGKNLHHSDKVSLAIHQPYRKSQCRSLTPV